MWLCQNVYYDLRHVLHSAGNDIYLPKCAAGLWLRLHANDGRCGELLSRGIVAFAAAHLMSYVGVCFANASAWLTAGIFLWIAYHFLMKKMVRDKKGHEERMLAEAMQ